MKSESIRKWNEAGNYTGKGDPQTFRFGPLSISRTSQFTDWASGLGAGIRRLISGETTAEKTGRMGLGHSGGYGGMKDPRWGMGGADYMYSKERGRGFHGYNRGGAVMGQLRPPYNPRTAPLRATGRFLNWLFSETDAEKTERLGLGWGPRGLGGFGPVPPARERGITGGRTALGRAKGFGAYNLGGFVPGFGKSGNFDQINAMLTPGEYVVKKQAVDHYGQRFMDDLNLQKLNNGGPVGEPRGIAPRSGGGPQGTQNVERAMEMAQESIVAGFERGSQIVKRAIMEALSAESIGSQLAVALGTSLRENLAATSIDMRGNVGVDVNLTGPGAVGDISSKTQENIKNTLAVALTSMFNTDGSQKDPSIHQPRV